MAHSRPENRHPPDGMNPHPSPFRTPVSSFRLSRGACLALCLLAPPLVGETKTLPPDSGLEGLSAREVKLTGGFWGARLDTHHQTTIPYVLDQLQEHHHFRNFDVAARVVAGKTPTPGEAGTDDSASPLQGNAGTEKSPGATPVNEAAAEDSGIVGNHAFDSDAHKALEGACHSLCLHDDPALQQRVDGILDRIVAAQQEDGYLVSYYIAKEPEKRWTNLRLNHEMYVAGHFFEFSVAHHQLTGKGPKGGTGSASPAARRTSPASPHRSEVWSTPRAETGSTPTSTPPERRGLPWPMGPE